jgi:hypothetical protein
MLRKSVIIFTVVHAIPDPGCGLASGSPGVLLLVDADQQPSSSVKELHAGTGALEEEIMIASPGQ